MIDDLLAYIMPPLLSSCHEIPTTARNPNLAHNIDARKSIIMIIYYIYIYYEPPHNILPRQL
jgi:hypothetical protein